MRSECIGVLTRQFLFIFDVRRIVPYLYDTLWVRKFIVASRLGFVSGAPWWQAVLVPTIACGAAQPQPSAQASSTHHGQCRLHFVWDQSTGGASGEYHHQNRECVFLFVNTRVVDGPPHLPCCSPYSTHHHPPTAIQ
jgi:hypothetical protein